ncbi:MAG: hypothetical protein ACI9C1_002562 [Candidatus Aldehydirespiratoraceae bacterium]|jgi:hypothetical protein
MRRALSTLVAAAIIAVTLALTAGEASACSCVGFTDQQAFDAADTVFLGEFADYAYEEDSDGDGEVASDDPAFWTFDVREVFKGEARETERITSAVSGASCGIEISKVGTFYVFANNRADTLKAGLCGGTRAADATPLVLDTSIAGYAPIVEEPEPPSSTAPPSSAPPIPSSVPKASAPEDEVIDQFSGGTFFVVGFITVGILGAIAAARLAKRARDASDREWRAQDDE